MKKQYDRESAVRLLVNMRAALLARGENRYPQRDDFSPEQVVAIKAFLGPWPRALEAAGIKPPRDPAFREKQLQKRIAQRPPRHTMQTKSSGNRDSRATRVIQNTQGA